LCECFVKITLRQDGLPKSQTCALWYPAMVRCAAPFTPPCGRGAPPISPIKLARKTRAAAGGLWSPQVGRQVG
jgi:hypothetical protein